MRVPRIKTTGLALLLLGSTAAVSSVWAQSSDGDGGIQLKFDLGLGVETQTNRTLDPDDPGTTSQAFTDLGLGLSSITRTQELRFNLSSRLRGINSPSNLGLDSGFTNTAISLGYGRLAATSSLDLSASLRQSDLADTTLIEDEFGDITLVNDDGTRRTGTLNARYEWNQDARFRYGTSVTYTETRFSGGSAETLDGDTLSDSRRLTLGADATLDLSRAANLTVALSYSTFDEDGEDKRETWSFDNTLKISRPRGGIVLSFGVTDTEEGTRVSTRAGRTYLLPRATLFGEVGVTRETSGDTVLVGAFDVKYPLPRGALAFGLSRSVSSSNFEDEERLNTSINLGYQQALTPLSEINFNAQLAQVEDTETNDTFLDATIGVTYSRELTRDWDMDLGARQRYGDDDGIGSANSSEVFFNLRRSYLTRF